MKPEFYEGGSYVAYSSDNDVQVDVYLNAEYRTLEVEKARALSVKLSHLMSETWSLEDLVAALDNHRKAGAASAAPAARPQWYDSLESAKDGKIFSAPGTLTITAPTVPNEEFVPYVSPKYMNTLPATVVDQGELRSVPPTDDEDTKPVIIEGSP